MDLTATLATLAAALGLAGLALWGDRARATRPHGRLALLPWYGLIFAGLTVALFMVAHLLALLGQA